jgi:hypothetical protein
MAFSNAEKAKIRTVLGYPNLFRYKNPRLESALESVDADGEVIVRAELAAIAEIDTALLSGGSAFDSAGLKKVDEVEFQTGSISLTVAAQMQRTGRIHIGRISSFFGTPINGDYYGSGGYPGDPWSKQMGMGQQGSSFEIKLG